MPFSYDSNRGVLDLLLNPCSLSPESSLKH